jgi:hypothetical protein
MLLTELCPNLDFRSTFNEGNGYEILQILRFSVDTTLLIEN